jgi:type II secretory pathway component PulF
VLNKITGFYEKDIIFRQKLQSALRYPMIVLVVLAIAFLVIVTFVIPRFGSIYGQLKADLPLPTRMLIALNQGITHYWLFLILGTVSFVWGFRAYIGTDNGRRNWDRLLLKMPVFGSLITKVSLSRFFRMLAVMISSGIPIVAGLETTVQTADNVVISDAILKIRDRVVAGSSLSAPMQENKLFPPTAVQMVAVGEKSGMLDKMLMKSADYFDEETDYMVTNLMSLLEPFVILFLGMLVLTLALGIFLPMWNLMSLYTK